MASVLQDSYSAFLKRYLFTLAGIQGILNFQKSYIKLYGVEADYMYIGSLFFLWQSERG